MARLAAALLIAYFSTIMMAGIIGAFNEATACVKLATIHQSCNAKQQVKHE